MFDLQKFNDLLGTNFASIDEITDHQLLAALVTLTAASLGVSIYVCNPTPRALDAATPCAHRFHAEDDNDFICIDCGARTPRR